MDSTSSNNPNPTSLSITSESSTGPKALSSVAESISGSPRVNSPTSNAPKAILSCDFCRQRKTKCDKAEGGCSNCKRAGIKCNMPTRQRLPRGRNGGRTKVDAELKARVGRLENLVRTLGGKDHLGETDSLERALSNASVTERSCSGGRHSPKEPIRKTSSGGSDLGRYLGSSFWTSLTDEITGLRDVLDDESDDEPEAEDSSRSTTSRDNQISGTSTQYSFVLCTSEGMVVNPDVLQHPPKFMILGLCSIYLRAVDPVFKLIHGPSLSKFMQHGKSYLDYSRNHPAPQALAFAVYFAAINSQSDSECRENFGDSKCALVGRYKIALEAALSRADLLITNDITVLSALLLLIIFSRVASNDRKPWTLIALAVRIAHAMDLHREVSSPSVSPFWREIRRRVWNAVGVVDAQSAGDRGTEPLMINYEAHPQHTRPPLNINDEDLLFDSKEELQEREGITDMSFSLLCRIADSAALKIDFNAVPDWCTGDKLVWDWETRKDFAVDWRAKMHERFLKHCVPANPMHMIIHHVVEVVSIDLLLTGIRPLYRHPKSKPPRVSGDYILSLCASALERSAAMTSMPHFKDFLWFGRQYNQWHAIAVMAAELCIHTQGPTVERSWAILDRSLDFYKQIIADSEKGMLWRPIEKLLKKARENRSKALGVHAGTIKAEYPTAEGKSFPKLDMIDPATDSKAGLPQTGHAAVGFSLYDSVSSGPPMDAPMQATNAEAPWQLPTDFMSVDFNFDSLGSLSNTASPENAWQNWGSFTEGLQSDEALFPPMQMENAIGSGDTGTNFSPFPWC